MLKSMRKHGITLALFAAGSTGLTAAINELTKSTIAEQAATQQKRCSIRFCLRTAIITICCRAAIWSRATAR
jgi:Na+-translocating ferredoxin:NAD+ oxidoreductase RnfG subunit